MLLTINREAVILQPTQDFFDWLSAAYKDDEPMDEYEFCENDQSTVYLIPEHENLDQTMEYLKKNYQSYLKNELFSWYTDSEGLSLKVSWDMFQKFFNIRIQTMVFEAGDGPILIEDEGFE